MPSNIPVAPGLPARFTFNGSPVTHKSWQIKYVTAGLNMWFSALHALARVIHLLWSQGHKSSLMHALNYNDRFCTSEWECFISKHFVLYFCLSCSLFYRFAVLEHPDGYSAHADCMWSREKKYTITFVLLPSMWQQSSLLLRGVWEEEETATTSRSQVHWIQPF